MSKTVNNYSEKDYSEKDYSKILIDRIYNLESNIINLQKAIDNLQYNHSVQSSQAHLIKVRNSIISNTGTTTTGQRRLAI